MAAPTFVASYSPSYTTTTTPKTVSVTTQAGDFLVVYGGTEDTSKPISSGPSGNSVGFTLRQSFTTASYASAYLWTGTDNTGGTNWTLSAGTTGSPAWGFTCVVFRSAALGVSGVNNGTTGSGSLDLVTTKANSMLVTYTADWNANDGGSRTWRTVNGITPTAGSGELSYGFTSGGYTAYGAYYSDAGATGTKTVGISAPTGQKWSIVGIEVQGAVSTPPVATTAWFIA